MSYAIGHIIYGIPYSDDIERNIIKHEGGISSFDEFWDDDMVSAELDKLGFEFVYTGGCDVRSGWCGTQIDEIDECGNINIINLRLTPSDTQKQEVEDKFNKLPEHVKQAADPIGTYIVWGTS